MCYFFINQVTLFSIPKKLLHITRNKIEKESWQLAKKKKLFNIKKCQKMPKKLVIFSLKIHKGAGILKKTKNWSK